MDSSLHPQGSDGMPVDRCYQAPAVEYGYACRHQSRLNGHFYHLAGTGMIRTDKYLRTRTSNIAENGPEFSGTLGSQVYIDLTRYAISAKKTAARPGSPDQVGV